MDDPVQQHGFWSRLMAHLRGSWSRIVDIVQHNFWSHAAIGVLGGLVGFLVSTGIDILKLQTELGKLENEHNKSKIEIIKLVDEKRTDLANAVIKYYDCRYGERDQIYRNLLISIDAFIASYPRSLVKEECPASSTANETRKSDQKNNSTPAIAEEIRIIDQQKIKDEFWSNNRRIYAEYLKDLYENSNTAERRKVVQSLLNAIIDANNKDEANKRYRINLYIALAFSLLRSGALNEEDERILLLKEDPFYSRDPTFKRNVDGAFVRQTVSEIKFKKPTISPEAPAKDQAALPKTSSPKLLPPKKFCDWPPETQEDTTETQASWWRYITAR